MKHMFKFFDDSPTKIYHKIYYIALRCFQTYRDLFLEMKHTNFAALILSVICMVILYVTKEYLNPPVKKKIKAPIPIDLIVVSRYMHTFHKFSISVDVIVVSAFMFECWYRYIIFAASFLCFVTS